MSVFEYGIIIVAAIAVIIFFKSFFTVDQQRSAIVERFGRFLRIGAPGLNMKIPFIDAVRGHVNLRVRQLDVQVETKSEDNVFVTVAVAVQFHVLENKIYEAFYKLENPEQQITAFVFDVVRARVPKMKLDDVFEKKDEIADAVQSELSETMENLGYAIVKALVTDIDPDAKVKSAMNEINEAQRLRVAANERGEAEKILKVKQAEAEAQASALQGKGMADQRAAIISGLRESVADFQKTIVGAGAEDVMTLVLMTQYFDTLKSIGATSNSNTILLPHTPAGVSDVAQQIRDSFITANEVSKNRRHA